jgi:hypothetical protein
VKRGIKWRDTSATSNNSVEMLEVPLSLDDCTFSIDHPMSTRRYSEPRTPCSLSSSHIHTPLNTLDVTVNQQDIDHTLCYRHQHGVRFFLFGNFGCPNGPRAEALAADDNSRKPCYQDKKDTRGRCVVFSQYPKCFADARFLLLA